jgi:ABC-type nickel/cobalt efflux system permease component RcnA
VALLKNRTVGFIVGGIVVILALIGISSMFISNPTGFLQGLAVVVVIGIAIYIFVRLMYKTNPQKKEQRAFLKAAKKSKKRLQKKETKSTSSAGTLAPFRKAVKKKTKKTAHLTVIDGKKGKKKNRASF